MSGSTLSDRLKNVEDEINEITSLMSLNDSPSAESVCRTSSEASTDRTSASAHTASSRCHQNLSGSQLRRIHSRNTSRSDVRLGDSFQSFRSSSNSTAQSDGTNTINSNLTNNGSGKDKDISLPPKISPSNLPSLAGDDITTPHFDTLGTYLNCYTPTSKGNQTILAKLNGIQSEGAKPASAPSSTYSLDPPTKNYKELLKELENEKSKRITADRSLEECKSELRKYKQEAMRSKELYTKYCELNEQLEKENLKQSELLLSMEKRNGGSDVDIELTKQKCETILKDLQSEQERSWCQERELQRMKECMEQSQLKIQELMGARTMAVELAHDLQKKHHKYVSEHQQELQQLKNKNAELEKLQDEIIRERNTFLQQLHNMEDISRNAEQLESQIDMYKKSLSEAESTILEFSRNPENVPQVKNMLDAQEQTFKAALTEKATTEMALLAKYTTLEVELQIIQEDYNKKVSELEQEHKKTVEELNKKLEEQTYEISKLKLLTEELTEISNQYKARISELSDVNKHQEVLIKCQNEAISSKEERVRLTNQEADLNVRRADQEKKALVMEHEKSINNLKKLLDEERDKVRVKEKIADDQAETIIRLKQNLTEKSKELQRKQKEYSQIENSLKQEKQERENLYCDVQHLKMHRSRLKESISELQSKLETASKLNPVQKKHTQMLEELERKVAQKQAEWDSEISKLTTERDQARETAQYAIENLSSAMEEYQKELANQKNLQTKLAALIREKEEQLNVAENKITKLENEKELVETSSKLDKMRYTIPERLSASETTNSTTMGVSTRRHSALEYYNSLVSNQELNINQQQQLLYSFNY